MKFLSSSSNLWAISSIPHPKHRGKGEGEPLTGGRPTAAAPQIRRSGCRLGAPPTPDLHAGQLCHGTPGASRKGVRTLVENTFFRERRERGAGRIKRGGMQAEAAARERESGDARGLAGGEKASIVVA